MAVNGKGLAAVGIGSILIWSGVKGWSVLGTIGDLITGTQPSGTQTNAIALASSTGTASTNAVPNSGAVPSVIGGPASGLAAIALQYQGHAYRFGGAPGPSGANPWDCSSFMNYVISVKGGRAIPGYGPGKYNGSVHGPTSGQWAIWSGVATIPQSQVQAGDLACWTGHIGMAISPTQMISALNPSEGTRITVLNKSIGSGAFVRFGRLK